MYGLVDACGGGREIHCESSLGDNVIYWVLLREKLCGRFCTYLCPVLLCMCCIFWLGYIQPWRCCVSVSLMCILTVGGE